MSHTYVQNVIHVVFSTKDRRKTISPGISAAPVGLRRGNMQESLAFMFMRWGEWRITFISSSKFHRPWRWQRRFRRSSRILRDGPVRKVAI